MKRRDKNVSGETLLRIIKQFVPWWCKIAIKIILGRFPLSYHFWGQRLGLFQHGRMLDPEYSCGIFDSHYSKTYFYLPDRFVVCELGPGDSLATAMIAPCYGAVKSYLVDVGNYADNGMVNYKKLDEFLIKKNLNGYNFSIYYSLNNILEKNNACYLTKGFESLRGIPGKSIDLVFSQAVLEHIRLEQFSSIIKETYRILKPGGCASHRIDLKDHLGGGLNNLRFSRELWESNLFTSSGFYTNRLRASEIINILMKTGFKMVDINETRWISPPLARHRLSREFSNFSENDLIVSGLDIVLQK